MKTLMTLLTFIIFYTMFTGFSSKNSSETTSEINSVLGDISYLTKFGNYPDHHSNETERIGVHLEYVENLLREKDVSHLSSEQRAKRKIVLELLKEYHQRGNFPVNIDYKNERKPCFIDQYGNICAVGYLVEQTAGRATAERLNSKYQYSYITEMRDDALDRWIKNNGLTKEECAMIQPTYGNPPQNQNDPKVSKGYATSSAVISGANLSLSTVNAIQLSKGLDNEIAPIVGLITGAGQLTLGILNYPEEKLTITGTTYESGKQNVSILNIGIGAGTFLLSGWNLLDSDQTKGNLQWDVNTIQTPDNQLVPTICVSKTIY